VDDIVAALYDTISGPAEAERDWDRLHNLFYPGARLLRTVVAPNGGITISAMDVQAFAEFATPYFRTNAFYEREISRRVDGFGQMAQVFSTYEASSAPDGTGSLGRGINSIQLWSDGRRWWVMSMLWDDERPGNAIPSQYLP
jgi:hypothetical protein